MDRVFDYMSEIVPVMLCVLPVAVAWRFFAVAALGRRGLKTSAVHECGVVLLACFCAYVASKTILPGRLMLPTVNLINLVPFRVFADTYRQTVNVGSYHALWINLVGNIAVFMPIGFLSGLCFRPVSAKRAALIGFCGSLAIEVLQLFSERRTDIDDLWLNALGALAGYGVYAVFARLLPHVAAAFKVRAR